VKNCVFTFHSQESKLKACAEEIKSEFKVETKFVARDFSKVDEEGFAAPIAAVIKDLDVGLLVNNVGMSYPYPCFFADEDSTDQLLNDLVKLNVTSTTMMTKLVLPGMVERKRGAIISISSAAGNMTCGSPLLAGYSGTKAYIAALTKSIQYEVSSKGIVCQTHVPYFVTSKLSKIRKTSITTPSPDDWVAASLKMFGYGGTVVVPYFPHFLQDYLAACIPEFAAGWYTCNLHKSIRKRALKKAQEKQSEGGAAKKD
jgi:17beta-estradiol 17-dehydrogenase / very-long-chain 3-oxoacyl-CoA reductase